MKKIKRILVFILAFALCGASFAAEAPSAALASVLHHGVVEFISKSASGTMTAMRVAFEEAGEYTINLSPATVWIDAGAKITSDPATLKKGEKVYVYHSPASTRSIPPQSAGYAIVRNVPDGAVCPHYHLVEAVDGKSCITTDNGGLILMPDKDTSVLAYSGTVALSDIKVGSCIMAWYDVVTESYPAQAHPSYIMLLNNANKTTHLTRAGLAVLLHTAAGNPTVNYLMGFVDVTQDSSYAEAVRWVAREGLMSGYGDGRFGPDDLVTKEQALVVLWRQSGAPHLTDYAGLGKYSDLRSISYYAQPALAWAYKKGAVPTEGRLGPKDSITQTDVEDMLQAVAK